MDEYESFVSRINDQTVAASRGAILCGMVHPILFATHFLRSI